MNRRQELCRNFLRGSCKYGANCRFLHTQQQTKPQSFGFGRQSSSQAQTSPQKTNPFGFGSQASQYNQTNQLQKQNPFSFGAQSNSQYNNANQLQKPNPFGFGVQRNSDFTQDNQQKPNPFGFGVQSSSQLRNGPDSFARKPFENKWIRPSSSAPTKQNEPPTQSNTHTCTSSDICKQLILDDSKNEFPLWKLTCYGHRRSGPCDILGDISFEELRSAAYEEARQGHTLQSIIERERNILNAKLIEFDNLFRNPYANQSPTFPASSSFPSTSNSTPSTGPAKNTSSAFGNFVQQGGATSAFSVDSQGTAFSGFGRDAVPGVPSNTLFGQNIAQMSGGQGAVGVRTQSQLFGVPMGPNGPKFDSFTHTNRFSNQITASSSQQDVDAELLGFIGSSTVSSVVTDQTQTLGSIEESKDDSIWLKDKWSIGEIPEDEPPARFCRVKG